MNSLSISKIYLFMNCSFKNLLGKYTLKFLCVFFYIHDDYRFFLLTVRTFLNLASEFIL